MHKYSAIAQSLYKARHDRMLWPVYHAILQTLGVSNDKDETTPWYKEKHLKCSVEEGVKVLWGIPIHQFKPYANGANKPEIVIKLTTMCIWGPR